MNKRFLFIWLVFIGLTLLSFMPGSQYAEAVDRQLKDYPQSTLQDIYKSFFQDEFGPGHIVSDTASARAYLRSELAAMERNNLPYYEPAGCGKNFFRVNLAVITDGLITEDEFFDAFVESAGSFSLPSVDEWKPKWDIILQYVPADLPGYNQDKARIDSVLSAGEYAIHHSRRYNDAYRPHYRIISKRIFETKLLPKIRFCCHSRRSSIGIFSQA